MPNPAEQFKINLNQNLWGLVVGLISLGASEYYHLCALFWFSLVVALMMVVSVAFTTFSYTVRYCEKKNDSTQRSG